MTARTVDEEARRIAVERLDGPLCVEAGAGTGKTTLLVGRYLALLRAGRAGCARIVAITFTEKAAGEMKLRIRREIDRALAGKAHPADERARLAAARRELEGAPISTIHAFASSVIREFPVEAGVDPSFDVLDPVESELFLDECWIEFLAAAGDGDDAALLPFLEAGGTHETLREIAFAVYRTRSVPRGGAGRTIDTAAAAEALRRELLGEAEMLETLAGRDCVDLNDRGFEAVTRFVRDARRLAGAPAGALPAGLLSFPLPLKRAGAKKNWDPPASCDLQKERLAGVREALGRFAALWADAARDGLLDWLDGFVSLVDRRKEERGALDFDDLLLRAARVTGRPASLAELRRRYRYLLVDEFQDTDPLQARILLAIAGSDDDGRVTGNLFVVGDPKQSIYRFRGADVEIYETVAGTLANEGARLSITQNFRSVPGIASWVNGVFSRLIAPPADGGGYQARYEPIDAYREGAGPAVFALHTGIGEKTSAEEARRVEGIAVARLVSALAAEGPPVRDASGGGMRAAGYGDIAVLYPGTTGIHHYEEPFRVAGIPCVVDGGKLYYTRQEVRDVGSALAAIEEPWDGLSVFACLRSPFFGFSDEELFLHSADGGFDYRRAGATGDLGEAFALLRDLHDRRGERGAAGTLATFFEATGYRRLAALRRGGERRLLDLRTAVDLARSFDRHHRSFRSFARWFAERDEAGTAAGESPAVEEGGDAVRLMTIHRAKGLQFPVVILANLLQRRGGGRGGGLRLLSRGGSVELRAGRLETSGFEAAAGEDALREEAERIRLMYVAATRAGDRLYVPVGGGDRSYFALLADGLPAGGDPGRVAEPASVEASAVSVDDLPSLPSDGSVFAAAPAAGGDEIGDVDSWRRRRADLVRRASAAPAIITPSGAERADEMASSAAGTGDGEVARLFGVAFHELMERLPLDEPGAAAQAAAIVAERHGLAPADGEEMARLARQTLDLDVIRRAAAAPRLFRELPFVVPLAGGEPPATEADLLRGRIDLLFEEGDGWTAVDYKTDDVEELEAGERLGRYRPQGALYALAARRLGLDIRRVVFVFARPAAERTIVVDDGLVEAARRIAAGNRDD